METVSEKIKLTQYSHGAGCGCKIAPAALEEILKDSRTQNNSPLLLVGNESGDDAAVYDLGNDQCLISTVDFFMPVVNDPFSYGRIAAANALSDVYAMGGRPIMALALLGWPIEKLSTEIAREVMAGGRSVCELINIPVSGGHTIDTTEPIFGMSVNGLVKKENIRRNNTAQPGDLLFLTKPIGTGILSTALKRNLIGEDEMQPAIEWMCALNSIGEKLGTIAGVHAMTDVTGFGLLGHLLEMCEGSNCSAEINYDSIKLIAGAKELAKKFVAADNTFRNWKSFEPKTEGISGEKLVTLCDPQTSGGLLVAVGEKSSSEFIELLKKDHLEDFSEPVGRLNKKSESKIIFLH